MTDFAVPSDGFEGVADELAVLCPVSAGPCPARENIVALYGEHVDDPSLPPECASRLDGVKMNVKLGELTTAARLLICTGPESGVCPTRESMNNSPLRTGIVD